MTGKFIDDLRFRVRPKPHIEQEGHFFLQTDYGLIHTFDTRENKPVIINVPDGPNVIAHQKGLIEALARDFRVVCFEYPGLGYSFPNARFDYSFEAGAHLLLQVMEALQIERASLVFSCSNGFYAMKAAEMAPDQIQYLFLVQTPSTLEMVEWTKHAIPEILKVPVIGQIANALQAKKLARIWYRFSLPKGSDPGAYQTTALDSLDKGGCFCLSSLVKGLQKEAGKPIAVQKVPTTLVWGGKDYTHRHTDKASIHQHLVQGEIIEFPQCGHFPELENTKDFVRLVQERIR